MNLFMSAELPRIQLLGNRRAFLRRAGLGFGSIALAGLLQDEGLIASTDKPVSPLAAKSPHFPATAKRVIWLFMGGGPSQVDTFDYKPELERRHGQPLEGYDPKTGFFDNRAGAILKSPFSFRQYGESAAWVSSLFPNIAKHVDKMAFIRSCYTESNNHAPAIFQLNGGLPRAGFPSMGSWLTYGLGSANTDLPGYVVMTDPKRHRPPKGGSPAWSAGFLPGAHAGTPINSKGDPISHLTPPHGDLGKQRRTLDFLQAQNRAFQDQLGAETELAARIESFELAYRMQTAAPEAMDVDRETEATKKLYGLDQPKCSAFGKQCLMARRLVERGVRCVQIYSGGDTNPTSWDAHNKLKQNHSMFASETDLPIAGLLEDLEKRGLLEDTLVVWGGEFGRTPVSEGPDGRDHNPFAFTTWMAGGGVKGGTLYGETDEFGWKAVKDRVSVHDLHATILHLLGLDHENLTYRFNGRDYRLTDVHGHVIQDILQS